MIAYVDSSVLLRLVLRQPGALKEWSSVEEGVTSALTQVECLRTLDRLRVVERIPDEALASRREAIFGLLATLAVVDIAGAILDRAALPLPTALGTLDAIHLATAQLWRERTAVELTMATHDAALATAARSLGMPIVGG
jgi:predicted nucleic acid-binding protein